MVRQPAKLERGPKRPRLGSQTFRPGHAFKGGSDFRQIEIAIPIRVGLFKKGAQMGRHFVGTDLLVPIGISLEQLGERVERSPASSAVQAVFSRQAIGSKAVGAGSAIPPRPAILPRWASIVFWARLFATARLFFATALRRIV